jgi:hypothetical protein
VIIFSAVVELKRLIGSWQKAEVQAIAVIDGQK